MHKTNLKGKRILFLGQVFYDYHTKILNALLEEGAEVIFIPNKFHGSVNVSAFDIAGQLRKIFIPINKRKYKDFILSKIENERFDYLFCISGFSITNELMNAIHKLNPGIKTIIYFWDSFKTWNYAGIINLFDTIFSFDPEDAKQYDRVQYLPLFYTDEYKPDESIKKDIDLLYIGSVGYMSKNRLSVLKRVAEFSKKNDLNIFIWAFDSENTRGKLGKIQSFFKRFFVSDYREFIKALASPSNSFIKVETLKRDEVVSLMKRSKCVIDIPVPEQKGLTIRTIETLAINNRLITTNKSIVNESFYDPNFINVVEESEFELDMNFINMVKNGKPDVSELELKEWLIGIFDNVNELN